MKARNKKRKGKQFENKVADIIHSFFYNNNRDYKELYDKYGDDIRPKRDLSSGTLSFSYGDIELNMIKPIFPFTIECKHWKKLDLTLSQLHKKNELDSIWKKQLLPIAKKTNLSPLLVFKANRTEIFCMFESDIVDFSKLSWYNYRQGKVIALFSEFLELWNDNYNKKR